MTVHVIRCLELCGSRPTFYPLDLECSVEVMLIDASVKPVGWSLGAFATAGAKV